METLGIFITFKYADVRMISDKIKPIKQQKLGKFILLFSSCSFGIYFSHYILMQYFFYNSPILNLNAFIGLPVTSIILICSSWFLIWVMSKISILKIGSSVK